MKVKAEKNGEGKGRMREGLGREKGVRGNCDQTGKKLIKKKNENKIEEKGVNHVTI